MRPPASKSLCRRSNGMLLMASGLVISIASAALELPSAQLAYAQQSVPNPQVERELRDIHATEARLAEVAASAERNITSAGLTGGLDQVNRAIEGTPAVSPGLVDRAIDGIVSVYNYGKQQVGRLVNWIKGLFNAGNLTQEEQNYYNAVLAEGARADANLDAIASRGVGDANSAAAAANATAARSAGGGSSAPLPALPGGGGSNSGTGVDEIGPAGALPGAGGGDLGEMSPPAGEGAVAGSGTGPDESQVTGMPNSNQGNNADGPTAPDFTLPGLGEELPGGDGQTASAGGAAGGGPGQNDLTGLPSGNQANPGAASPLPNLPPSEFPSATGNGTQNGPLAGGGGAVPGAGSSPPSPGLPSFPGPGEPGSGDGLGSLPGLPPVSVPGGQTGGFPGSDPFAGGPGGQAGGFPGSDPFAGGPGGQAGGFPGSDPFAGGGIPGGGGSLPGLPGSPPLPPTVGGGFPNQGQPGAGIDPITGLPTPGQVPGSGNAAPLPGLDFPSNGPGVGPGGAAVPGAGNGSSGSDPLANLPIPGQDFPGLTGPGTGGELPSNPDPLAGLAVPGSGRNDPGQTTGPDSPALASAPGGGARSGGLGGATPGGGGIQFPRNRGGAGGGNVPPQAGGAAGPGSAAPGATEIRGPRRRNAAVVAPRGPRSAPVDRDGFDPDVIRLTGKIVVLRAGISLPDVSQLTPGEAVLARVAAVDALLEGRDMSSSLKQAVGRDVPLLSVGTSSDQEVDPDLRDFAPDFLDDFDAEDGAKAEKPSNANAVASDVDQPSIEVWLVADWEHYSKSRYRVSILATEPAKLELDEGATVTVRGLVRRERLPEGVRRRVLGDIAEVEVQSVIAIIEEDVGEKSRD